METLTAAERLAALGHESRLSIYRLLVEAGHQGMIASAIAEKLGLPAATLSFHLSHLSRVQLVRSERESRFIRYFAEFETMDALLGFLTRNCCQGQPCLPSASACSPRNAASAKGEPQS
ncbi:helix-turn-helix transcriptional regulator [Chromobacterium sp. IIBBL 290-4]|uniref:ArsR/SmtB family transcription factor n=1 Tax=Chromobacterium sp. IIBBL 290-4 TaxID=2953890 RepID=UPI0020B86747|nr:metalloregulator ArsR/SmtB family transcription factor [Chromobacterium sp. IIBBL 290-4]UTH73031.1 metalloregulator ArsR/SmtB family transcription factor [Chromobacterium sp. IIBBL 290-4]